MRNRKITESKEIYITINKVVEGFRTVQLKSTLFTVVIRKLLNNQIKTKQDSVEIRTKYRQ